ncbi:hypothetical protein AZE42_08487 [Rhizopogon vesiculosus]|uniref:Uncharacterized protein n=1 Tax=Rhizopogon vesiculosus TaxID=180088 RepID=A0A1J8QGV2_9AGAM|nr:hypothetical protein AZE42_08487 [Rhizopogon vesiculosus]
MMKTIILELDLSDSEEAHTQGVCDTKVKGKSRNFETPNNGMSNEQRQRDSKVHSLETAAIPGPLFLSSQSILALSPPPVTASLKLEHPELSCPSTVVSVSKSDILWRNEFHPDDILAPAMINPWEFQYSISLIDFLI